MFSARDLLRTVIVAVFLVLAAASLVTKSPSMSAATPAATTKSTAPARGYYLTTASVDGSQVLSACVAGYHTAEIYEILQPSNLRYDTTLGFTEPDSGAGPPNGAFGWARTGGGAHSCLGWTDNTSVEPGTIFALDSVLNDSATVLSPWVVSDPVTCNNHFPVWCVQN